MSSRTIDVTVTAHAAAAPQVAFDTIAPIDLAGIFDRWVLIPGVDRVSGQSGAWDAPGRTRTVHLGDGTEVNERLTAVERPDFTSRPGRRAVTRILIAPLWRGYARRALDRAAGAAASAAP